MHHGAPARWLLIASMVAAAACGKRVEIDGTRLGAELDARAGAALSTPAVEKSLEELFAAVGADPRVGKAGSALASSLGDDPRLQPGFAHIIEALGEQPAMQAIVRELMRTHPGATPDQIGALMEKRISGVVDGPVFDRAFDKAFDQFLKRPEVNALMNTFGEKVARNPHAAQLISSSLEKSVVERKWRDRLVALNGGSVPDRQRATDLVAGKLLTTERMSKWYAKLYGLATTRREIAAGAARLLEAPAFRRVTADLSAAVIGDPLFQKRAVEGMNALLGDKPSTEVLEKAVARLLDVPVVSTALSTWLKALMSDRELAAIGEDILKAVATAPEMRTAFAELTELTELN